MGEKHSAVGYLFREGAFLPAQETKPVRNEFGLDLFQHRGSVYEGKTGLQFCSLKQAEDLAGFVEKHGGIEKVQKLIADSLERTGLSPRYTRPDEKKKDIFPPKEKDENRVFAKDLMGNKHYYYRFYNENGIELYTMEKKREFFQTVYIPCDGFMVGIDQRHRLEEVLKWLPTLSMASGVRSRGFSIRVWKPRTGGLIWDLPICLDGMRKQKPTMPPLLRNGSGKLMKGGRSKTPVNSSWHKNDRPVTIPPSVRPKEILWRERR